MSKARKTTAKIVSKSATRSTETGKSFYERHPLPFFDMAARSAWAIKPTGDYIEDCETGREFARQFLATCDGTIGWSATLSWIVTDMIRMGAFKHWADGGISPGGIVIGFMSHLGRHLCATLPRAD